jgi:hypothetical protein
MAQQVPHSQENHYGGQKRHQPEHDMHIQENFTDDNQDFQANGVQNNDVEETKFSTEDRLGHDHHDRPEPQKDERVYKPSIYSEGGHGRHLTKPLEHRAENADNKDYAMNKDSEQGAQAKYENTEDKTASSASKTPQKHWWSVFKR